MNRLLTLILALLLLVVGCSSTNTTRPVANDGDVLDEIVVVQPPESSFTDENQTTWGEIQQSTANSSTSITRKTYALTTNVISPLSSAAFNEGVAWTSFRDEEANTDYIGLINTDGRVLYMVDSKQYRSSENKNTVAVTRLYQDRTLIDDDVIVDRYGNPVFSCADETMKIIGYCHSDGSIFLSKHTDATFSSASSDYLYIFDCDFNLIETGIEIKETNVRLSVGSITELYPLSVRDTIDRISDGLYYTCSGNGGLYINLKTGAYINCMPNEMRIMHYYDNGYAVLEESGYYYLLPIQKIASVQTYDELKSLLDSKDCIFIGDSNVGGTTHGLIASHINDDEDSKVKHYVDRWWCSDHFGGCFRRKVMSYFGAEAVYYEYIDMEGNIILKYPAFPDGVTYNGVSGFSNGYSAVYLTGIDQKEYDSVIDENGNLLYEPIAFSGYGSCNGYIFGFSEEKSAFGALSPTGEFLKIQYGLPGFDVNTHYCMDKNGYLLAIQDGYIFYHSNDTSVTAYYALDGNKTIDRVYAEFDQNGFLLIDDAGNIGRYEKTAFSGDETKKPEPTKAPNVKQYKTVNSFAIEGKWKNTGTYTYGQAQNGAIIVFNGTNCNFVSPQDTYAFYKNGDHFRLDCTTYMFSQTLSFTVKIIDDNHIDVYNGSYYIELTRVSD